MPKDTLESMFNDWWQSSYGRPPGMHAVMTHVGFAAHVLHIAANKVSPANTVNYSGDYAAGANNESIVIRGKLHDIADNTH